MTMPQDEPVDVVYTWVDDQQPGYRGLLSQYAKDTRSSDPSRTRDNLQTLRFSMRSLERYAPWVNHVYLLTCRPQVPDWLNIEHPKMTVVHHDEVMSPEILPTFNSLAIITHLHRIPGLARRFLYLEDDMLFLAPVSLRDFTSVDGLQLVFEEKNPAPRLEHIADPATAGGWNLALAQSNALLDHCYGRAERFQVNHSPLLIDKGRWEETLNRFPETLNVTRNSRFRSAGNFAPEFLYLQVLLAEQAALLVKQRDARKVAGYVPLENFWPITAWRLWQVHRSQPKWVTLNDNFGQNPSKVTVALMRRQLQAWFPSRGEFERR